MTDGKHTNGKGRYCLAVCYCGECPHWKPMPRSQAAPEPKTSTRQAKTWAQREEPTWIDKD